MRRLLTACTLIAVLAVGVLRAAPHAQSPAQLALDRAIAHFRSGRVAESVTEFDAVAKLAPDSAPYLWQRGIALYYAGRYRDCRAQFESHRAVNPDDVENAAWHFLCVARAESFEKARAAILPVGADPRVPMREIYQMFSGALGTDKVLSVAAGRPESEFYGHLYVGLYLEALGRQDSALEHIKAAAGERYAQAGGYMHLVARTHLAARQRR
jgi:lipoprotein NlpI